MLKKKKEKENIITVNVHWYFVNICDSCTTVKQLQTQDVINRRSTAPNSASTAVSVLQGRMKTFVETSLFSVTSA